MPLAGHIRSVNMPSVRQVPRGFEDLQPLVCFDAEAKMQKMGTSRFCLFQREHIEDVISPYYIFTSRYNTLISIGFGTDMLVIFHAGYFFLLNSIDRNQINVYTVHNSIVTL